VTLVRFIRFIRFIRFGDDGPVSALMAEPDPPHGGGAGVAELQA